MEFLDRPLGAFGILLAFAVANTLGSVAFFGALERALLPTKKLFDVALQPGQVRHEMLGTALFCAIFSAGFAALLTTGAIHFAEFSWSGAAITFLGCMLSWDVYYYFAHRALHGRRLGRFHAWHHASRVNTPWASFSMSPTESFVWVVGLAAWPVAASLVWPVVLEAWIAWGIFFWWSNVLGHVNVELAPAFVSKPVLRQFSHPVLYHALHHARYQRHYCFFLNSLDTLFGSVWPDTPALHERVVSGRPLTRLGERGDEATTATGSEAEA